MKRTFAIIAAMALTTPGTALADSAMPPVPDALALEALHNYAACAVAANPKGAAALLALDVQTEAYQSALRRYAKGFDRCNAPGHMLRFSGLPFAGDLAEALMAKAANPQALADAAQRPIPSARSLPEFVGACVAHALPAEVTAVLATAPGSQEELSALQATGATLPGCVPKGKTLTLNKPAVRAMYALGAYRLVTAPADGGEG